MKIILTLLAATLPCTGALAAGYRESRSGDLSDDGLNPTPVKLQVGRNVIDADFGNRAGNVDRDYFVIRIAKGQQLSAIGLSPLTEVGGSSSFIGLQAGRQVTTDPDHADVSVLLGWTHFATGDEGSDILPRICQGVGAQGCSAPLGPGTYAFWVQELSSCDCHYRFIFQVAARAEELDPR